MGMEKESASSGSTGGAAAVAVICILLLAPCLVVVLLGGFLFFRVSQVRMTRPPVATTTFAPTARMAAVPLTVVPLTIGADGSLTVEQVPVATEDLPTQLSLVYQKYPAGVQVEVVADPSASAEVVQNALTQVSQAGMMYFVRGSEPALGEAGVGASSPAIEPATDKTGKATDDAAKASAEEDSSPAEESSPE